MLGDGHRERNPLDERAQTGNDPTTRYIPTYNDCRFEPAASPSRSPALSYIYHTLTSTSSISIISYHGRLSFFIAPQSTVHPSHAPRHLPACEGQLPCAAAGALHLRGDAHRGTGKGRPWRRRCSRRPREAPRLSHNPRRLGPKDPTRVDGSHKAPSRCRARHRPSDWDISTFRHRMAIRRGP